MSHFHRGDKNMTYGLAPPKTKYYEIIKKVIPVMNDYLRITS